MPLLPYGAYLPDTSDYESRTQVHNVQNVVPRADGYGPWQSFSAYANGLPDVCRGAFYALKSDGSSITFAGTATNLYMLNNITYTWSDVSNGSYNPLSNSAQWRFAQTGNFVWATQANAVLQVFDLSSSSTFGNALGSPPQAAYIDVVGRFLVLSGLLSNPYRIQWSGLNNFNSSTSWDNITAGANSQDFPDGGIVRGVAGGEFGTIFQDQAIRRMAYVPGSPLTFQIERISQDKGLYAPYSIIRSGETVFFYANQGFHKIDPGGLPEPIGIEKVDRTFLADLDRGNLQLFIGASDPRSSIVYWAYKSVSGTTGLYDKILGYHKLLDRFFPIQMQGEYLVGISQAGVTLESLDAIAPTSLSIIATAASPADGPFGGGKVRLTLNALSNASFSILTQNSFVIYGCGGTAEANGTWYEFGPNTNNWGAVDSTHIDLNVPYSNAYTGGGKIGGSLDAMILSLDNYATAVQPAIAQFDSLHTLGLFSGPNLEATLESAEQGTDGRKITVKGFRPISDAIQIWGSLVYRDNQQSAPAFGSEALINSRTGRCDTRTTTTRYARFRTRIPAGVSWTFCAGVEPDVKQSGYL